MILLGATDVYWLVRQTDCKTKIGKESMGNGGAGSGSKGYGWAPADPLVLAENPDSLSD